MNFRHLTGPVDVAFDGTASLAEDLDSPVVPQLASNGDVKTYTKPEAPHSYWTVTAVNLTEAKYYTLRNFIQTTIQGQKTVILWTPLGNTHNGTPNAGTDFTGYIPVRVWAVGQRARDGQYYSLTMTLREE